MLASLADRFRAVACSGDFGRSFAHSAATSISHETPASISTALVVITWMDRARVSMATQRRDETEHPTDLQKSRIEVREVMRRKGADRTVGADRRLLPGDGGTELSAVLHAADLRDIL